MNSTHHTAITALIPPVEKDLGGFNVRRLMPKVGLKRVGPWVFFDHMGPADFDAGQGIDVRPHPHINLATVSYLFEGEILHRDSLGSVQLITPGDINLMVAGRGIVHSERERPETRQKPHRLHGLQLWLALPEADEETVPEFLHYPSTEIPEAHLDGVPVRVMIGSAWGLSSPVKQFAPTLYAEAWLQAGQSLRLPDAEERAVYVAGGELTLEGQRVPECHMAVLDGRAEQTVTATRETRLAIIGGDRIGARMIDWNFVSSRPERIRQARDDWANGRFPTIPGDDEEFIPLPE